MKFNTKKSNKAIERSNSEIESNNKKRHLWEAIIVLSLLVMALVLLILHKIYEKEGDVFLKFAEVLGIVGIIEFIFHNVFTGIYTRNVEIKIKQIIKDHLNVNQQLNNSGIRGCQNFYDVTHFLDMARTYLTEKNKPNKSEKRTVRILMMFITEISGDFADNDTVKFKAALKNLLEMPLVEVEIILPNYTDEAIRAVLRLREKSIDNANRLQQVKNTINHLAELKKSIDKKGNLHVKLHQEFISFPLLSYGNMWFQGNYFYSTDAEREKFIEFTSLTEKGEPGKSLETHFKEISAKSISLKDFEAGNNQEDALYSNAGNFLESIMSESVNDFPVTFLINGNYSFYTHSVYKKIDDHKKTYDHYLSRNTLQIVSQGKNFYKAKLKTETFDESNRDNKIHIHYDGIISFDKLKRNILMIFYKTAKVDHKNNTKKINDCFDPLIITGILPATHDLDILILHETFVSNFRENNISKIGVLELTPNKHDEKPRLMDIMPGANDALSGIKQLLMRKNKVVIKSPRLDHTIISQKSKINNWLNTRFPLKNYIGLYDLFYKKSDTTVYDNLDQFGKAEIEIMANGIMKMVLFLPQNTRATYFGEMNFQQSDHDANIVTVKFMKSVYPVETDGALKTDLREFFLFLFWDDLLKIDEKNKFEITRGICLGDRDNYLSDTKRIHAHKPVIESNQCVLVNKAKFDSSLYTDTKEKKLDVIKNALLPEKELELSNSKMALENKDPDLLVIQHHPTSKCKFENFLDMK